MALFDRLAKWLGLSDSSAELQSHPTVASDPLGSIAGVHAPNGGMARGVNNPYADLWQSVEQQLSAFMAQSVIPHRHFEPDDSFKLVRIQVTGTSPETRAAIDRFLTEFRPETRLKVVRTAVKRHCSQGVSMDHFVDFNRDFDQADLDESDPYAAQLSEAHSGGYQVTLFGEWMLQQPVPPSAAVEVSGAAASNGPPLDLEVQDAKGQRRISTLDLPLVVGRDSIVGGQSLSGTFLSRRHGIIERGSDGLLGFRDTSVNGSSVDGVVVAPGSRCPLRNGSRIVLGGDGAKPEDCPVLTIHSGASDARHSATPLRSRANSEPSRTSATPLRAAPSSPAATPLASAIATTAPQSALCMLAIQDASGSRTVAVTRLPYVIGRDEKADYRVPEANAGVSRQHLVIAAINASGAKVTNNGAGERRWGTEVDGIEQSAEFTLRWNSRAILANRYTSAPAVHLQLLSAS